MLVSLFLMIKKLKSVIDLWPKHKVIFFASIPSSDIHNVTDVLQIIKMRPFRLSIGNLIKLLNKLDETKNEEERKAHLSKLHEIVTWANIAMDEGDFGTCLELGLNLFSCGSQHVHRMALQQLTSAYDLLGRHSFSKIIKVTIRELFLGE